MSSGSTFDRPQGLDLRHFEMPLDQDSYVNIVSMYGACPSLVQGRIYLDAGFFEHTYKNGLNTSDFLSRNVLDLPPLDLAAFLETWLVHGLLKCTFKQKSLSVPRHKVTLSDRSEHFYYRLDELTYWLPSRSSEWVECRASLESYQIAVQFKEACVNYRVAQRVFEKLRGTLYEGLMQIDLPGFHEPRQWLWQWLLLFQIVGEQIYHSLKIDESHISHFRGHTHIDCEYCQNDMSQQFRALSRSWGGNAGLSHFRTSILGRCTSEERFIDYFAGGTLSTMRMQAQNDVLFSSKLKSPPSPRTPDLHRFCDSRQCNAFRGKALHYKTSHISPHCDCEHMGPDIRKIKAAIDRRRTPLVRIKRGREYRDEIQLETIDGDKHTPYIAISHVWADGRGNKEGNTLPRCQLNHLYGLCGLDESGKELPIWMDTLCIPCRQEDREYRTMAIAAMNFIYLDAYKVVVISNDLLDLEIGTSSSRFLKIDPWLQFRTCSWMRRCWTLQEGAFGSENLYVRFKDRLLLFGRKELSHPLSASPVFSFAYPMLSIFNDIRTREKDIGGLIDSILLEFKWRRTSWEIDEPAIFAGILGLRPDPIIRLSWKDPRCADKRLELLYQRISTFPTAVLYSLVDKMQVPGIRWAPRTLRIDDYDNVGSDDHAHWYWSELFGRIRPNGLEFLAHLILLEAPIQGAPESFTIQVTKTARKSGYVTRNTNDPREKGMDVLQLMISKLDIIPHRGRQYEERITDPVDEPIKSMFRSANKEHLPSRYYAIIMRGFDWFEANTQPFQTDAVIINVFDGLKYYKSLSSKFLLQRFLVESLLSWPEPLVGEYICPARVQSVTTTEYSQSTSLHIEHNAGESSSRRAQDRVSPVSHSQLSPKAAGKQPSRGSRTIPHTSQDLSARYQGTIRTGLEFNSQELQDMRHRVPDESDLPMFNGVYDKYPVVVG